MRVLSHTKLKAEPKVEITITLGLKKIQVSTQNSDSVNDTTFGNCRVSAIELSTPRKSTILYI